MSKKEQLWYLIDGVLEGSYDIKTFCDEFVRIYNLEVDYASLSQKERETFKEIRGMTARFSDNDEELKIPAMYFSKDEIMCRVKEIHNTVERSY